MDGKGYVVDVKGYVVDVKGYVVDVKGYVVDVKGYVVGVKGFVVDVKGYIVDVIQALPVPASCQKPLLDPEAQGEQVYTPSPCVLGSCSG